MLKQIKQLQYMRDERIVLPIILIFALILRIYNLGTYSIWADEAFTITIARENLQSLVNMVMAFEPHPPLHYVLLHYWTYFGDTEFILRLPSVIFGVLTVFVVYIIGRDFFSRKVGFLSAVMVSVSSLFVSMSQEARTYSMLGFLMALSFYFLLKILDDDENTLYWAGFISSIILSFYAHYYTVFIIIAMNLFLLILKRNFSRKWILSQVVVFIGCLPGLLFFIQQYGNQHFSQEAVITRVIMLFKMISGFSFGLIGELSISKYLLTNALLFSAVIFGGLALFILFLKGVISSREDKKFFVIFLFFLPLIAAFLMNFFMVVPIVTKRFIFLAPLYFIFLSWGIFRIKNKKIQAFIIFFILITNSVSVYSYYQVGKLDWRSVTNYIESNSQPNDVIGIMMPWLSVPFNYYYDGDLDMHGIPIDTNMTDRDFRLKFMVTEDNVNVLEKITEGHDRIWLVQSRENHPISDPNGLVKKFMDDRYTLIDEKIYSPDSDFLDSVKIYLYVI